MTLNSISNFVVGLVTLIIFEANSQKPESVTYSQLIDEDFRKTIPLAFRVESYKAKDGTVLKEGMKFIVGKPSSGNFALWKLGTGIAIQVLSSNSQAEEVTIEKIQVSTQSMSKSAPRFIVLVCRPGGQPYRYTLLDYERGLTIGEVINPNAPMSREAAIAKLKESKELLDLGVID